MTAVENPLCIAAWTNDSMITETPWLPRPARPRERHQACGKGSTKLRSRSSPVRLGELPARRRRQRSPTVSPPQPSLRGSPFSKIDDICDYINQESKCPSRKSAYFSKRPPREPLRVVVLSKDKLNTSNILLPPSPYTDATSPPPKAHRSRTRQRQNEGHRASCHLVHGLLTDLTDNLPLVPPAPFASPTRYITRDQTSYDVTSYTKGKAKALSPLKLRRHRRRVSSAKTGNVKVVPNGNTGIPGEIADLPFTDVPVLASTCRNVAVQARTRSRSTLNNTTKAAKEAQVETEVAPAAVWMGDVRALRDSHVRLVRRQLRHIAQLNRALDYARYPQSTTPPHPGLPMQQTQSAQSSLPTQPAQSPETRPLQSSQSSQLIQSVQPTQREKSRRSSKAMQKPTHLRLSRRRE